MSPGQSAQQTPLALVWGIALLLLLAVGIGAKKFFSGGFNWSASEPAHGYQADPETAVRTMFGMLDEFKDNLSTTHLLTGKDSSPQEQRFSGLFWDNQRSAVLYSALYDREPELQTVGLQSGSDDSANVNAAVKALATANDTEKTDRLYIFELRKRGANWYIYDLRSNQSPTGVFERFQKTNKP